MKIRSLSMIALVLGALLLAGCHKLEATTKIERNGSGELQMGVGFSAEERANLEKQNNKGDFCNASQSAPKVSVVEEMRGDETWCITTTQFKTLDELRSLYEERKGIKINRLEISAGKLYYDIEVDTLSETSNFSALTDMTWSLVLPGSAITDNADQVNENTLTWTPAPKSGVINLYAESDVPRSGFDFLPCSGAFIGLGVICLQFRGRRKNL